MIKGSVAELADARRYVAIPKGCGTRPLGFG